jgi:hypothetical protein
LEAVLSNNTLNPLGVKFFDVCSSCDKSAKLKSCYIVVFCFQPTNLKHYNVNNFINFFFVFIQIYYIPHFDIHVSLKH